MYYLVVSVDFDSILIDLVFESWVMLEYVIVCLVVARLVIVVIEKFVVSS
jgi:hypothetical protein